MNNSEQEAFWNGRMGKAWTDVEDYIDRMLAPLSAQAIARADTGSDDSVIDVGCGGGTTSLQLSRLARHVLGIDISEKMINHAAKKANEKLSFMVADAANHRFASDHSLLFSRFGVMFFADPVGAFANLRTALNDNGRVVFLCWRSPAENPWISIPGAALQPFQPADTPPPDPSAPGPFAFADRDYAKSVFEDAGFTDFTYEPVEATLHLGDTLEEAMVFQASVGPLGGFLDSADEETGTRAQAAVESAFSEHLTETGLDMPAAAVILSARR